MQKYLITEEEFWSKLTSSGKDYALMHSGKEPAKTWASKNRKLLVQLGYVKMF